MTRKIDDVANMWNETKDPKYKKLWYDLVKEFSNGPDNIKRRSVSINSCNKEYVRGNSLDRKD
tara:strand:+ start:247 stop:435 length:189 start_codon:yes stop_codon:yes gene_type:complete